MSDIQITCSHCSKTYVPFKTAHGAVSKLCPKCRENQQKSDEKRKGRIRNYQAEAKRNLEANWKMFQTNSDKRQKECSLTKEQYFELIQKPCVYCSYYNENEINGIDRVDNSVGYILQNCVTACKHCNRMKHILHPAFFIGKAQLISRHQKGNLETSELNDFYRKWKIYIHKVPTSYIYVKRISEEKRELEYSLTKEQYDELIYKPCYLCGFKNSVGNGLDRQDNNIGYTYDNVLPCCSTCNMMKSFYNKDEFIAQMLKIKSEYSSEWDLIPCVGFQMGASKSDTISPSKDKQWRAVSIFKAVKSDTIDDFKHTTLISTGWSDEIYSEKTADLFKRVHESSFDAVENELKRLVEMVRYHRLRLARVPL